MNLIYIAPSFLPSINANGVHVVNQCKAFSDEGANVTLVTCRKIFNSKTHHRNLLKRYGSNTIKKINKIVSFYYPFNFASSFMIALYSFFYLLFHQKKKYILSRNLYASLFCIFLKSKKILYETHQLEIGFRKMIQKKLILSKKIKIILISFELKKYLENYHQHKISKYLILHDAAPANINVLSNSKKMEQLTKQGISKKKYNNIIGYFGQLYEGRGIELISKIAIKLPKDLFLIIGGTVKDVDENNKKYQSSNLKFISSIPHPEAILMMQSCDILLMPYQEKVSIGQKGHDTSAWMSPMKMFEYMASSSAIISSDHKVLKEVLRHEENSLITNKYDYNDWVKNIKMLQKNNNLMNKIKLQSYKDYRKFHTWNIRAKSIINFFD